MTKKSRVFAKKKVLAMVFICAAVLLALVLIRWHTASGDDFSTLEGRQTYLSGLGWEIDPDTEEYRVVIVPDVLDGVMEEYNRMQLEQGCDLGMHLGERCDQYTYQVTNYRGYDGAVLITIYVQGREMIAGDIHTTSIDGFMHGIKRAVEE